MSAFIPLYQSPIFVSRKKENEIHGSLAVPDGIPNIKNGFMRGLTNVEHVSIPTSCPPTSIGATAFNSHVLDVRFRGASRREVLNSPTFPFGVGENCVFICTDGKMNAAGGRIGADFEWDVVYPIANQTTFSWAECRADVTNVYVPASHSGDAISGGSFENLECIVFQDGATKLPTALPTLASNLSRVDIPQSVSSISSSFFRIPLQLQKMATVVFHGRSRANVKAMSGYPWGVQPGQPIVFYCSDGIITPNGGVESEYIVPFGSTEITNGQFRGIQENSVVAIPPTVERIGDGAFRCESSAVLNDSSPRISYLFIPYGVKYIGAEAFYNSMVQHPGPSSITRNVKVRAYDKPPQSCLVKTYDAEHDYYSGFSFSPVQFTEAEIASIRIALIDASRKYGGEIPRQSLSLTGTHTFIGASASFIIPNSVLDIGEAAFMQAYSPRGPVAIVGNKAVGTYNGLGHYLLGVEINTDSVVGVFCEQGNLSLSRRMKKVRYCSFLNIDFSGNISFLGTNIEEIESFALGFYYWKGFGEKPPADGIKSDSTHTRDYYEKICLIQSPTDSQSLRKAVVPTGCKTTRWSLGRYSAEKYWQP